MRVVIGDDGGQIHNIISSKTEELFAVVIFGRPVGLVITHECFYKSTLSSNPSVVIH